MRVGIDLSCWSNRRGYGRFTRGLVGALARRGDHDYVFFIDKPSATSGDLPAAGRRVVVPTSVAPSEAAGADSSRSLVDMWRMSSGVAAEPLDVFFFPSVYTYFPLRRRLPTIVAIHDVIAEDYPDLVFSRRLEWWRWRLKSWVARRQATHLVAVSEHAGRGIERRFGKPKRPIHIVGEAPDPAFRRLSEDETDHQLLHRFGLEETPFLIYLGGVNPHKQVPSLVDAVAELRRRPGLGALKLVVVGDVEGDNFNPGAAELRQRIEGRGVEKAVRFTGYLNDDEVTQLMNQAKVLVLPSLAEGYGLPAVEAAACGTPVVATSNSPLPELLRGGGLFVEPGSTEQLTEALGELLGDEGARRGCGEMALERARHLTWDRSAEQFLALLATIDRQREGCS